MIPPAGICLGILYKTSETIILQIHPNLSRADIDTVANCYAIMGSIHQRWPHIPARWRDFITHPKSNFYQSIHTTIITREGVKFEIQIRTFEMHRISEQGIAAHWKYKEGSTIEQKDDQRFAWLQNILESQKEMNDSREFLDAFRVEVFRMKFLPLRLPER